MSEIEPLTQSQIKEIEKKALRKIKQEFLKIDKEEVWISYLTDAKEKDPYEYLYDNNLDL